MPPKPRDYEKEVLPHLRDLYGAALRLCRNPDDASDLVQEASLRAFRFWDSFERGTNCRAWLFRILTNVYFSEFNRRKRRNEVLDAARGEQSVRDGVLIYEASDTRKTPEDKQLEMSLSEEVQHALAELTPEYRVAIVLCDMQGFSYKETADILGCPMGTVMSRLHRGRKVLAKALRGYAENQGIVKKPNATDKVVSMDEFRGANS